ncbi:MAG: hypothetical protein KM296_00960 [Brockia lithotrophica]|nr:hypothetical protein [Brockia lithotrophica]MBT9252269.1 hypothetical protein [Brockia lithotrophica]
MGTSVDRYAEAVRALSRTYAGPARAEMLLRYLDENLGGADWPDGFPRFAIRALPAKAWHSA